VNWVCAFAQRVLDVLSSTGGAWGQSLARILAERAATFGCVEAFGWFILAAILLVVAVSGVVTMLRTLRS
jgi:hypothetical protein